MRFENLKLRDVRMLSLSENTITVILPKDRIETFTFNGRDELEDAIRKWAAIPDSKKPALPPE